MPARPTAAHDHRIVHHKAPTEWALGFPLGNGEIGAMFWGGGAPLAFTLDKADLWDLRSNDDYLDHPDANYEALQRMVAEQRYDDIDKVFDTREKNPIGPTKISIGRAELDIGDAQDYECGLAIGPAMVEGSIRTANAAHKVQSFVHRNRNVLCVRVTDAPATAQLRVAPLVEMNEDLAKLNHPKPLLAQDGDRRTLAQSIPEGPSYALAWNATGPDFFLAIESADSNAAALAKAEATLAAAQAEGFDALRDEHVAAWDAFWATSAVYLPEERVEFLWYFGLYLLASSSRRGSMPPGLQGLWAMDGVMPPWRGDYHADMNVQEQFWPALASGHIDLIDSWCDFMKDSLDYARKFTRRFFGTEGAFWPASFLPKLIHIPGNWHACRFGWSHAGWLSWMVWLRWRHSMDMAWLADTGYPIVAEVFRFYRANLKEEADGRLHIPLSNSPEYASNAPGSWCKDPTIDIALIRRCCDWIVAMEHALGRDELSASALQVHDKMLPYPLAEGKVLCLWPGKPLDESHRHPSHLMPIHPAMDITIDDGAEARAIINASLQHFFSLGQYEWAGHTYAQMASFGAAVGRAEFAYDCIHQLIEYWLGPNWLHFNRDMRCTGHTRFAGASLQFTMEANCGANAGISDMLVQGWRDVVRVFPAMPGHWRDAAFRDLVTEGAFRVSGVWRDSRVAWVKIVAGAPRQLRLRNPFGDAPIETSGAALRREGDLWVADLAKGQEATLWLKGEPAGFGEAIKSARASDASRFGLR